MWAMLVLLVSTLFSSAVSDILVLPLSDKIIEEEFRDMPASFGNGLPYDGLRGMLIYADPPDGCGPLKEPPTLYNPTEKWIVVVARYNCTFEMKVRNAQKAKYDAAIVHNMFSEMLEQMSANNSVGIHIPSVFVGYTTGKLLRDHYASADYYVIINSEIPFNINTHLLLPFAIVVGICFLVMVIFMITKFIRDRRRQRRDRLSSSSLNKIPVRKFEKGDPYETCAICLDDYVDGEKLRILPCAHAYHSKCIDPWLTKNRRVCPVCKRKVFAHDENHSDSDSDTDTDDTTPLLRGADSRNSATAGAGTFNTFRSNIVVRMFEARERDAASFVTASDQHSINGEQNSDLQSSSDYITDVTSSEEVHTLPSTSNTTVGDVII